MGSENNNNIILPEDENEAAIIELEGEQYEVIDTIEFEGRCYIAILPYSEDDDTDDDEDLQFTILELIDDGESDECTLRTIDDDDLYTKVGDEFLKRFDEYDDEEDA